MNNYEYFANNRRNYSVEANILMDNIRNGYVPSKAESFLILSNNQKRIRDYMELCSLKERIQNSNSITFSDLNLFFNTCSVDKNIQDKIINSLNDKGLLVRDYSKSMGMQYVKQ